MHSITHVIGIDPGLVHTGVVSMGFFPADKMVVVLSQVVTGPDVHAVTKWLSTIYPKQQKHVFIEQYVPRQRLNSDERMLKAEARFKDYIPNARLVRNTGAKQIVTEELMQLLQVWNFSTSTHHQDLRSAARIALYGMMKNKDLNLVLADFVRDHLDGCPWKVV